MNGVGGTCQPCGGGGACAAAAPTEPAIPASPARTAPMAARRPASRAAARVSAAAAARPATVGSSAVAAATARRAPAKACGGSGQACCPAMNGDDGPTCSVGLDCVGAGGGGGGTCQPCGSSGRALLRQRRDRDADVQYRAHVQRGRRRSAEKGGPPAARSIFRDPLLHVRVGGEGAGEEVLRRCGGRRFELAGHPRVLTSSSTQTWRRRETLRKRCQEFLHALCNLQPRVVHPCRARARHLAQSPRFVASSCSRAAHAVVVADRLANPCSPSVIICRGHPPTSPAPAGRTQRLEAGERVRLTIRRQREDRLRRKSA